MAEFCFVHRTKSRCDKKKRMGSYFLEISKKTDPQSPFKNITKRDTYFQLKWSIIGTLVTESYNISHLTSNLITTSLRDFIRSHLEVTIRLRGNTVICKRYNDFTDRHFLSYLATCGISKILFTNKNISAK